MPPLLGMEETPAMERLMKVLGTDDTKRGYVC